MKTTNVLLLIGIVLAVFSLLIFSSWTNAYVVEGGELSSGLSTLSTISPLLIGIFIIVVIALLILISVD